MTLPRNEIAAPLQRRLEEIIGARTGKPLADAFGIRTVGELLAHYPRRLQERGELTELSALRVDDHVTVLAEVQRVRVIDPRRGASRAQARLEVVAGDGRATLDLVFFGSRNLWRQRELAPGTVALFSGKVGLFRDRRQLAHPEYKIIRGADRASLEEAEPTAEEYSAAVIPVYPATEKVRTWTISRAVHVVLAQLPELPDPLPSALRVRHKLIVLDTALRWMHEPADREQWQAAHRRLRFDEALGVQLALAQRRRAAAAHPATPRPSRPNAVLDAFDRRLPFTLTEGQREVGETLRAELSGAHPMHRLLQGEVGSGKTVVALRAMLQVIDAGGQAALLAPTEVLAAQHARTLETLLGPLGQAGRLGAAEQATRVALLTGSLPAASRREALLDAASGAAGIVVGTHALIQDQVSFAELGLVVVDEQHRFGVEQRDALRAKSDTPPHLLVMTATPIPRTVAMTVFGDLETSTLAELPAGRAPIATSVVPAAEKPAWLQRGWARIREEVDAGRQVYVVCPRIGDEADASAAGDAPADAGDGADLLAAEESTGARRPPLAVLDVLAMLRDGPLAGLRLAALHGRLPAEEKDEVMRRFAAGELDVLVATTVVEVGVDVPNATVMAVLDAERFGVSQLHQLRGRVGRGGHPGLCLLITESGPDTPARERLAAVAATTDGFALARLDVAQRREGDVLGAAQSGRRSGLRLLSLLHHEAVIAAARDEARALVDADPPLAEHPLLAAQVAALVDEQGAEFLQKA